MGVVNVTELPTGSKPPALPQYTTTVYVDVGSSYTEEGGKMISSLGLSLLFRDYFFFLFFFSHILSRRGGGGQAKIQAIVQGDLCGPKDNVDIEQNTVGLRRPSQNGIGRVRVRHRRIWQC